MGALSSGLAGGLGFLAPWVGEGLSILKATMATRHEIRLLELQYRHQSDAESLRYEREMDLAELKASVQSKIAARKPHESFGVKMLDAASKRKNMIPSWLLAVCIAAFTALDWLISSVRPVVAYLVFGTWLMICWTQLRNGGMGSLAALASLTDLTFMVAGFYFGERTRRRVSERRGR